jgi:hypothetical protein
MSTAAHDVRALGGRQGLVLKLVGLLAVPVLVLVVFLILVFLRGGTGALEVNAREGKITWKPTERAISPQKAQGLDPSTHFIDSARGFEFKKLGPDFGTPKTLTLKQLVATKGITAALGSENVDPITSELYHNVQVVRFSAGHDLQLRITQQTKLDLYGKMLPIGIDLPFTFANELLVYVFPKNGIGGLRPNVVQFYGLISQALQPLIQELSARESSILAFAQADYDDLRFGSRTGSLHVDRAVLVTESPTAFYGVEIQFSNELNQSADLWRQLREAIESFRVIDS